MSTKRHIPFHGYGRGQVRTLAWKYASDERIPLHNHGWHQLIYATAGVMTIETANGIWVVPTHRGVWVPARVDHAIKMSGAVDMRTLYFSPRLALESLGDCRVLSISPLVRELLLYTIELGSLDRRVAAQRPVLELLVDRIAALPVASLQLPQLRDPRALRIAERVLADPGERVQLAALAKQSGGSKRTIERAFKLDTGMTFGRWRQHARLVHAIRLLAAGKSVTSVALEVGYDSVSAFVSGFRKAFGRTPGRYYWDEER
jgi:AraC-like DNA-binding protein